MYSITPRPSLGGLLLLGLIFASSMRATPVRAQADSKAAPIIVKLVDKSTGQWRFEPDQIEVELGHTIRFVQEDIVPHNVEFRSEPKGSHIDDIRFGPFLMSKGDTYEIKIDERFVLGDYKIVCTPHAPLGMKATITVTTDRSMSTN